MANSVDKIIEVINSAINAVRRPVETIPSTLILSGAISRPGLSSMMLASNIIKRFSEAGCYSGPLKDGSPNRMEIMERIRAEEYIKAIKMDSRVQIAIPPGTIQITAEGANGGGPVVVHGTNINAPHGDGLIS